MTDFLADAGVAQHDLSTHAARRANPNDKFYTPAATAERCIVRLMEVIGGRSDDLFIEPSAGAGAFCAHLPGDRLIALDIAPEASGIETQDFLTFQFPDHAGRVIVIGNPPFGHNGTLARAFLRKAMDHADTVAYILPASYAKPSMQRGINRSFHLIHQELLPGQHFETPFGDRIVNTVFQIWRRQAVPRNITLETISETDFAFVQDIAQADLVIRRVGARAGILLPVPNLTADGARPKGYAKSSNYYISSIGCDPATLATRLDALGLPALAAENGIMPSLPKPALIAAYDEAWRAQDAPSVTGEACTDETGIGASVRLSSARDMDLHDVDELEHPGPCCGEASLEPVDDHTANEISHSGRPDDRRDQGPPTGELPYGSADADGTGEVGYPVPPSGPSRPQDLSSDPQPPWIHTLPQGRCPSPTWRVLVPPIRAPARISPRPSSFHRSDRQAAVGHAPLKYFRTEGEACAGGSARGPPVPGCRTGRVGVKFARAISPVWRPRPILVFQRHNAGICRPRGDAVEVHELIAIVDARPPLSPLPCKGRGVILHSGQAIGANVAEEEPSLSSGLHGRSQRPVARATTPTVRQITMASVRRLID